MSDQLIDEIQEFLRSAELSNYEINAYVALLRSGSLTARELSIKSSVPTGRIYEILEELKNRKMIVIQDSRPKEYRTITFNLGFENLISHLKDESTKRISYLVTQAKSLEDSIYKSDLFIKRDTSKVFWSTAFDLRSMMSLYHRRTSEIKEEVLMTGFINENTFKVIPYAQELYSSLRNAYDRGVSVKYLWSFEHEALTDEERMKNGVFSKKLLTDIEKHFNIPSNLKGLEMRFIHKRLPTYYDIFDRERVIIKLLHPLEPSKVFACIDVIDHDLAEQLRDQYLKMWAFKTFK